MNDSYIVQLVLEAVVCVQLLSLRQKIYKKVQLLENDLANKVYMIHNDNAAYLM